MSDVPPPSHLVNETFVTLQHSLRSYLRRRVGEEAADDLLQDVFVKALMAMKNSRAPRNLPGWLYAAARTAVVDFYRAKRPTVDLSDDVPGESDADEVLLREELAACLQPLSDQLPEIYRDTLLATDFEGKTMQTVAQDLGLSVSAIKSRASRGRALLKEKLLECCRVEITNGSIVDFYQQASCSGCGATSNGGSGRNRD